MDEQYAKELRRMLLTIIRFHEKLGGHYTIEVKVVNKYDQSQPQDAS